MAQARVVLSSGEVRLELEGDQGFVESNVEKLWSSVNSAPNGAGRDDHAEAADSERPESARQTLKTFVKVKKPANAYEAMATVLHYKRKYETKDELSGEEIRAALIQGGHRPPESMAQALTDGRRKYGYIEAGTKKGLWRLSHQGETLVE